jgi:DNA-directed RNA polymerase specialized sigma24 family protein
MQAARWADDIRTNDKQQHRALWHYINWPFKPDGQPANVQTREPESVNILTAMMENQRILRAKSCRFETGGLWPSEIAMLLGIRVQSVRWRLERLTKAAQSYPLRVIVTVKTKPVSFTCFMAYSGQHF